MPHLPAHPLSGTLSHLIRLYLKAETDIINEIGRLRSQGLVDYHAVAALERVQAILRQLESDEWEYVPRLVESHFYAHHPEARTIPGESIEKHRTAYLNAQALTSTQSDIVQRLTMNLMGQLTDGNMTVLAGYKAFCWARGAGHLPPGGPRAGGRTAGRGSGHQPERPRFCGGTAPGGRHSLYRRGGPEVEPAHLRHDGLPHHLTAG